MKNKYLPLLFSILAIVIPIVIFFEILMRQGLRPLYTDSVSFDSKIILVKEKKIKQIDLLAIGSSITLNNLSSAVIKDSIKLSYFNFSAWGLQIGDLRKILISYVPRYKPKYVLICSSLHDFTTDNFDDISKYINTPDLLKYHFEEYFYIGNYNSIKDIHQRKIQYLQLMALKDDYPSLKFDAYGGVLLNIPPKNISSVRWNQYNVFPTNYTNQQYAELTSLCIFLKSNKIPLIFIQTPIRNAYLNTFRSNLLVTDHFDKCKTIISKYGGIYLNFVDPKIFSDDKLFVDQFHLSQVGATLFTKELTHTLKNKGIR